LNPGPIDLDELLRSTIDLYEPSMNERGIRIRLHSAAPVQIVGDAGLIHRMVANLFDNELKHLPSGCSVDIYLQKHEEEARLTLRDNGPGFDPDVREQLFTKAVKGKRSSGHGLGLAFVDAVVRAHSGRVRADNMEAGGASIVLSLPLAAHEPEPMPTARAG